MHVTYSHKVFRYPFTFLWYYFPLQVCFWLCAPLQHEKALNHRKWSLKMVVLMLFVAEVNVITFCHHHRCRQSFPVWEKEKVLPRYTASQFTPSCYLRQLLDGQIVTATVERHRHHMQIAAGVVLHRCARLCEAPLLSAVCKCVLTSTALAGHLT